MCSTRPASPKAPVTDPAKPGLLLCAHGVGGGPGVAAWHAARLARRGRFAEVRACCLKGRPTPAEAVAAMRAPRIHLVPLLMAEGYTARQVLPRALAALGPDLDRVALCRPLGLHRGLTGMIARAARRVAAAQGWPPGEVRLLIVGHGTPRDGQSGQAALARTAEIAGTGEFAEARAVFLDQAPYLAQVVTEGGARPIVAVGWFADHGLHGEADVSRLLAVAPGPAAYAGPIGAAPEIADLLLDQAASI